MAKFGCRATRNTMILHDVQIDIFIDDLTTEKKSLEFNIDIFFILKLILKWTNERYSSLIWLMKHLILCVAESIYAYVIQICTTPNVICVCVSSDCTPHNRPSIFKRTEKKENGNAVICRTSSQYTENETDNNSNNEKKITFGQIEREKEKKYNPFIVKLVNEEKNCDYTHSTATLFSWYFLYSNLFLI